MGPYQIVQKLSDLSYMIRKSNRDKPIVVHIDKLKKCVFNDMNADAVDTINNVVSVRSQMIQAPNMNPEVYMFTCGFCERSFVRKSDFNRHNQDVHEKVKTACAQCDVVLGSRRAWKRHTRNVHEEEKRRNLRDHVSPVRGTSPPTAEGPAERPREAVVCARHVRWEVPEDSVKTRYVPAQAALTALPNEALP